MPSIALTFDDGPDVVWTPQLLDVLAEAGASATFFPIAARAAECPNLITRMLRDGHTVGLHCFEHIRHTERDAAWLRRDTSTAVSTLVSLGADPVLWRTPWGVEAPWTAEIAREHGLELIRWSVDTHDWRGDNADAMLEATQAHVVAGAVVLAHDGIGPGAQRQTPAETVSYAKLVLELAAAQGLTVSALRLGAPA